jgi:DNA-binding transcriptional ArsR family regulator
MDHLNGILIARSSVIHGEAHKVLWYLTARLEFDRFSVVNIAEISWDLGLKSQAVSRALRNLIDGGIVERGPRVGKRNSFRFARSVAERPRVGQDRPRPLSPTTARTAPLRPDRAGHLH